VIAIAATFLKPMMPQIILATAASGVFVVLGIMILGAILFEKWYSHHGRLWVHFIFQSAGKALLLARTMAVKMGGVMTSPGLKTPGKLSSGEAVRLVSGRRV
jgi:hypothetical protein